MVREPLMCLHANLLVIGWWMRWDYNVLTGDNSLNILSGLQIMLFFPQCWKSLILSQKTDQQTNKKNQQPWEVHQSRSNLTFYQTSAVLWPYLLWSWRHLLWSIEKHGSEDMWYISTLWGYKLFCRNTYFSSSYKVEIIGWLREAYLQWMELNSISAVFTEAP